MDDVGTDVQGIAEINKPWNVQTKLSYQTQLDLLCNTTRVPYSPATAEHDITYQPRGTVLIVAGTAAGRSQILGHNDMGQFCWHALQGEWYEEIIFITAYIVWHVASDNAGPHTAYTQQYAAMRDAGTINPNTRRQQLQDLSNLIEKKREEGYRPVLMMDANGDYKDKNSDDTGLENFIQASGFVD